MELDRDTIVEVFRVETAEHLTQIEGALIALEAQPADDEALAAAFRGVHTLKGNVGVLELAAPEALAHAFEGVLDRLRARALPMSGALVTLMLSAVDALHDLVAEALAGAVEMRPAHRRIVERLQAVTRGQAEAAPAPSAPAVAARDDGSARTLRVDVAKLDRMLDLVGEVAVARGRLLRQLEALGQPAAGVLEAARETDALCHDLQELVMSARMVPIGALFRRQMRTVRDLGAETGRRVRLVTEGEDVEVDTAVIERLADPLTHMIRNAVDHGLEPPERRVAAGKDPCGTITLRAFHRAGSVVVELADDGAGLDRARIAARARERGLIPAAHTPGDAEAARLIFEPGFTTADTVTTLSGRGVGMDVVRRNVEALRGTIAVESASGRGTTLTVRLPLTLAIIEGLAVRVGGESYVVPLESVVECLERPAGDGTAGAEGYGVMPLRGAALPYVRLGRLFDAPAAAPSRGYVVVVRHGGGLAGLDVDDLLGETQAVIKPLDPLLRRLPGIGGSTILGDGRVALILDVGLLLEGVLAGTKAAA
jgi:two-component system chemotaxis sensor kinase CheA